MKWLGSLVLVVAVAGCGNNNNNAMDMSMGGQDLSASGGDMAMSAAKCDPGKQTGCATGQKCVLHTVTSGMNSQVVPFCTADDTVAVGATCTRGPGGFGDDNCAAGGQCTSLSNPNGVFACRHLCDHDSDCTGGQKCTILSPADGSYGYCLTPCDPFAATSTCTGGLTCAQFNFGDGTDITSMTMPVLNGFYVCRSVGTVAQDGSCMTMGDRDCAAGLMCDLFAATCTAICSNAHACPGPGGDGGLACLSFDNTSATSGLGFCTAM